MECSRCKKDFNWFTELHNYTFKIIGFDNKLQELKKKDLCDECANFYFELQKKSQENG